MPRDIVCVRNIRINTLHIDDDDDDEDDDDNNFCVVSQILFRNLTVLVKESRLSMEHGASKFLRSYVLEVDSS